MHVYIHPPVARFAANSGVFLTGSKLPGHTASFHGKRVILFFMLESSCEQVILKIPTDGTSLNICNKQNKNIFRRELS